MWLFRFFSFEAMTVLGSFIDKIQLRLLLVFILFFPWTASESGPQWTVWILYFVFLGITSLGVNLMHFLFCVCYGWFFFWAGFGVLGGKSPQEIAGINTAQWVHTNNNDNNDEEKCVCAWYVSLSHSLSLSLSLSFHLILYLSLLVVSIPVSLLQLHVQSARAPVMRFAW